DCRIHDVQSGSNSLLIERKDQLAMLDPVAGTETPVVLRDGKSKSQYRLSPDGRWILFRVNDGMDGAKGRIAIAPLKSERPIEEKDWLVISEGIDPGQYPQWAPNGKLIYYNSLGNRAPQIWAQRLDPASKRPVASRFLVYELPNRNRQITHVEFS